MCAGVRSPIVTDMNDIVKDAAFMTREQQHQQMQRHFVGYNCQDKQQRRQT